MKQDTLEQKATLITAKILMFARTNKIGKNASFLTKQVIKLAESEFSRGYKDGMDVGINLTNQAWIDMSEGKRNQIADAYLKNI